MFKLAKGNIGRPDSQSTHATNRVHPDVALSAIRFLAALGGLAVPVGASGQQDPLLRLLLRVPFGWFERKT